MNKKRILLASIISIISMISCTITISFAWFVQKGNISLNEEKGIEGIVKKKYFHRGKGTKEDPFVITSAKHYENLVELTNNTVDFWHAYNDADDKGHYTGFYFSIGCKKNAFDNPDTDIGDIPAETSDTYYIYDIDDKGAIKMDGDQEKVIASTSDAPSLNLKSLEKIVPLGTAQRPFVGILEGNGFVIKNLGVTSYDYFNKQYCGDVGVFGFVGFNGKCNNLYFDELEIDTSYAKIQEASEHTHHSSTEQTGLEDSTVGIGYIAGHIVNSGNFTDVYVNHCNITGTTGDKQRSTFGYYGIVENDYLGGKIGEGHNYEFTLDSKNVYEYFNNNYNMIRDEPFRSRNTEYHAPGDEHDAREDHGLDSKGQATHPFSDAVYKYSNRQYNLLGAAPKDEDEELRKDKHNYSLSTMGYIHTTTETEPEEYEVFYRDDGGNYQHPDGSMILDTLETSITYDKLGLDSSFKKGYYYYLNESEGAWKYFYSNNSYNDNPVDYTFNLSTITSSTYVGHFSAYDYTPYFESNTTNAYLIVDNSIIETIPYTATITKKKTDLFGWAWDISVSNVNLSKTKITKSLKRGTHYVAFVLVCQIGRGDSIKQDIYASFSNKDVTISQDGNDFYVDNYKSFTVGQSGNSMSLAATSSVRDTVYNTDAVIVHPNNSQQVFNNEIPPYKGSGTWSSEKLLFGKLTSKSDSPYIALPAYSDFVFRKEPYYEPSSETPSYYRWYASTKPPRTIKEGTDPTYVGDDTTYIQLPDADGKKYVPENIDIVGGGIKFYYFAYHGLILDFEIRIIRIESEGPNDKLVKVPQASAIGQPFYATKYCPNSIVLYLKNTANGADNVDQDLGTISFKYVNFSALGTSFINLVEPSFKKGNAKFLDLEDFGSITGGSIIDYQSTFSGTVSESGAKKCSYCALDKNRNILGIFDSNGEPSTGFLGSDGKPDTTKLMQIDTYVICLGAESDNDYPTWISKIDFSYKSEIGYGGTFGSAEYRSHPNTNDSTVFNLYYEIDSGKRFYLYVKFEASDTEGESGVYYITFRASAETLIKLFLYDTTNYSLSVTCTLKDGTVYDNQLITASSTPLTVKGTTWE